MCRYIYRDYIEQQTRSEFCSRFLPVERQFFSQYCHRVLVGECWVFVNTLIEEDGQDLLQFESVVRSLLLWNGGMNLKMVDWLIGLKYECGTI